MAKQDLWLRPDIANTTSSSILLAGVPLWMNEVVPAKERGMLVDVQGAPVWLRSCIMDRLWILHFDQRNRKCMERPFGYVISFYPYPVHLN